jgi:hypothetical protein
MRSYEVLPGFQDVYLEDSYVLAIDVTDDRATFGLEVVLRESHPQYTAPRTGEQYCYRPGMLVFPRVRRTEWIEKRLVPSTDASGSIDYGNIDELMEMSPGIFRLAGDWGGLVVESDPPLLRLNHGGNPR